MPLYFESSQHGTKMCITLKKTLINGEKITRKILLLQITAGANDIYFKLPVLTTVPVPYSSFIS